MGEEVAYAHIARMRRQAGDQVRDAIVVAQPSIANEEDDRRRGELLAERCEPIVGPLIGWRLFPRSARP